MAVAHVATGTRTSGNAGTTTTAVARPATGNTAGNLTLVGRAIKPDTATGTAEAGWTQTANGTGGTGTTGVDVGPTRVVVDYQQLAGGESGSVTFDQASTPNSVASCMVTYSKGTGTWEVVSTTGSDTTHLTGRTATGGAISLQAGDVIVAFVASDTDDATAYTSPSFTATGMTFGTITQRLGAGGVTQGNDSGIAIIEGPITAGTVASVAPTLTLSGGVNNCGPVAFVRLREIPPPAITQAAYRFYDDGTETGATALATQDTAYAADVTSGDMNLQLRVRMQNTNATAVQATDDFQLQWEKNTSGTWNSISAAGALVDEYGETNRDVALQFGVTGNILQRGQAFLGNGGRLTQIGFFLAKVGSPSAGNVTCALYEQVGTLASGVPANPPVVLATSTTSLAISSLTTDPTYTWHYFAFDGTFTLTASTPYAAVVRSPAVGSPGNVPVAGADGTSPTHPGTGFSWNGSSTWGFAAQDLIFRVYTAGSVAPYNSANLTDAAATTNRLGAGTGSFVAGKVSEDGLVDDLGWSASNYTELLYSVTLKQADLANGDTLRFRVLYNGVTTDMTYTQTPTLTVTKGAPAGGKFKYWNGSTWGEKPVKVWTGSAWVEKPLKHWTGSAWVLS